MSDLRADMALANRVHMSAAPSVSSVAATTSDLSIDEELVLHTIGWEPVELVSGVAITSVPTRKRMAKSPNQGHRPAFGKFRDDDGDDDPFRVTTVKPRSHVQRQDGLPRQR